jgi:pseudouridine synthase
MRINKFIASYLGISRRQADKLIVDKKVYKNNILAEIGDKVDIDDKICYESTTGLKEITISNSQTSVYYKPIFTLVSAKPEIGKKTIYDMLPPKYKTFKPAGRLDYMSEGLLVISQDGDLIYELTHPKNGTLKKYLVGLTQPITSSHLAQLKNGMVIDDYPLRSVKITKQNNKNLEKWSFLGLSDKANWYEFVLTEGRNNQIRKMCKLLDYRIVRLIRIQHGEFVLSAEIKAKKIIDIE